MTNDTQPEREPRSPSLLFVRGLLILVFLALLIRLAGFLVAFGNDCVQMDLSAFYTAGQSVAMDLSPYVNYVESDPPVWDGVGGFAHSRFLYPPLTARLFQALTMLSYHSLKFVWMILALIALAAALILVIRLIRLEESAVNLVGVGIAALAAYPVLTLLERGQVDSFTLLLIVGAFVLMKAKRSSFAAGGLLALSALLKLNCLFLLPFLLLRRQWRVAGGFVAGGVVLLGIGLVADGPASVSDYVFEQMPRIAEHGEGGPPEAGLPREAFMNAMGSIPAGYTVQDGKKYRRAYFPFVLNASLAQTQTGDSLRSLARRIGFDLNNGKTALVFLIVGVALVFAWERWCGPSGGDHDPTGEFIYWQLALTLILLCGPFTWAMTTVWLLPIAAIALRLAPDLRSRGEAIALVICVFGLLVAIVPDPWANYMLAPWGREWMNQKYIVAEMICAAGLLALWHQRSPTSARKSSPPQPTA